MAHEKPIRFTPRQLAGFTRGYSARLGAGGFGTVYGGALPNGLGVAVKVLRSGMGRRSEEQFMAEVGTIGRTHHINLVRLFGFCFDAAVRTLVYEFMGDGALDAYLFDRTRAVGDSDGLRSPPSSSLWAEAAWPRTARLAVMCAWLRRSGLRKTAAEWPWREQQNDKQKLAAAAVARRWKEEKLAVAAASSWKAREEENASGSVAAGRLARK
ncbi:hypothetical protein OsJ_33679 [Oryza sativa Japonica Group]|uniref:Protein kinase domain-containing protein n=1 Tax=Oryza sativa subsp. japonica TaxID=39947 RepID=B9GAD6_ORYSJ|nr:hypothetical protein OsJ_33679 [Oryza sativa Japonica Group]